MNGLATTVRFAGFGVLFGFLLSRAGATDYDAIAAMFLLTDLHLMGVIGLAVVVAGSGLALLRRRERPLVIAPKPRKPGNLVGGLLFGAGWALTGTCPGTVLAQLGEGQWAALFTVSGILAGTALYRAVGGRVEGWLQARRSGFDPAGASRPTPRPAPAAADPG